MSRMYVHRKNAEDLELSGREVHLIHYLDKQIGTGLLYEKLTSYNLDNIPLNEWLKMPGYESILSKSHILPSEINDLIIGLHVGYGWSSHESYQIKYNDEWYGAWAWFLTMNSIYGSDTMKLIGQLSAQMEIHAHIYRENFNWCANLLQDGLDKKILRNDMGWDTIINTLRLEEDNLLVLSYSVCEPFPNATIVDMDPDIFYEISYDDRWDLAVKNLDTGCEINPKSITREYC